MVIRRRQFLVALGVGAIGASRHATAQPVRRIGILIYSTPAADPSLPVFREAMSALGWVEHRNITFEYRYAEGRPERLPQLATELAQAKPEVIYALGGDVAPFARAATASIPIVMVVSNDPVAAGIVASLARPGGNMTGVTFVLSDLAAKRVEILREVQPKLSRLAVLWNPDHPDPDFRESQAAAAHAGVRVVSLPVRRADDFEGAFDTAQRERAEALIVVSSRLMTLQRRKILEFTSVHRIALATGWGAWADAGALFTYGPNIDEMIRRSATYVDRVLRGAKPADLPVEQPSRFELVVNARTARELGLTLSQSFLARADRLVQ